LPVLTELVEVCQEQHDRYVCLRPRPLNDLLNDLGSDRDTTFRNILMVVQQLDSIGVAKSGGAAGMGFAGFNARPTYWGMVRVTRQVDTEWQAIIRELLESWETTNSEFKQELN